MLVAIKKKLVTMVELRFLGVVSGDEQFSRVLQQKSDRNFKQHR
jgi:hypothetical protein